MVQTKIGVLGSGDVGRTLAGGFARHGFDVAIGTRDPDKLKEWAGPEKVRVGTFAEAAEHGEVLVLAVLGTAADAAIDLAGAGRFEGKLVLDATNPLDFSKGMPPGLFVGATDSLGERNQRKIPGAKVVKCFNTVPNAKMVDPKFGAGNPPMMICGDDADAKKRTEAILRELGWPGVLDVGGIDGARWLEASVALWARVGIATGSWDHVLAPVR